MATFKILLVESAKENKQLRASISTRQSPQKHFSKLPGLSGQYNGLDSGSLNLVTSYGSATNLPCDFG